MHTHAACAAHAARARSTHLGVEAQINHAVGLIQHNVVALIEDSVCAVQAVQQTHGRCDDDFTALAQLGTLVLDGLATHDGNGVEAAHSEATVWKLHI